MSVRSLGSWSEFGTLCPGCETTVWVASLRGVGSMSRHRAVLVVLCIAVVSIGPLGAPRADAFVDGEKDWRQLYETTG